MLKLEIDINNAVSIDANIPPYGEDINYINILVYVVIYCIFYILSEFLERSFWNYFPSSVLIYSKVSLSFLDI